MPVDHWAFPGLWMIKPRNKMTKLCVFMTELRVSENKLDD